MSRETTVAIVGSGPAGTAVAHLCASRGIDCVVFEKGPPHYRHPFTEGYTRELVALMPPAFADDKLQNLDQAGAYKGSLNDERRMIIGGAATLWGGLTPRMFPVDFQTRSHFRYGVDWPITYAQLEPYYCKAEAFIGVSGTDEDNPFAPPRSKPFPLPPFELGYYDRILAERAKAHDFVIHTTQQARLRNPHDGRAGCQNFGVCWVCPTGAMYAPNHHLQQAQTTGKCTIKPNTSVRRIVVENGHMRGVVVSENDSRDEVEYAAKYVVVAGGMFESIRLLMLSDKLGNHGGHLGQHVMFKHIWRAHLHFKTKVFASRIPFTAQSQQFVDSPTRGKHGGLKINLSGSAHEPGIPGIDPATQAPADIEKQRVADALVPSELLANCIRCALQAESTPNPGSFVALSDKKDKFGDPFAKATVENSDFDRATYDFAKHLLADVVAPAVGASDHKMPELDNWVTGHHHFGGCRMGKSVADSVVDAFGEVHDTPNLFVLGSSTFPSQSCNNPTLTIVALAIRTAELIAERAGGSK